MRVLIVSSRFPWPSYTGDRIRTAIWLDALHRHAGVTLVSPPGEFPRDRYPGVRFIPARTSPAAAASATASALARGLPLHALIAAPFNWKSALREAGETDLAIILLSRLDPWVARQVRAQRKILDAVDSLAASVSQRASAARGPSRLFWSFEKSRTRRLESSAALQYEKVLVVSAEEAQLFGGRAEVVPNGIEIEPLPEAPRFWDCAFWGRLGYFANRLAAIELLTRVWPRIRAAIPEARLLIAGADAPAEVRAHHGRDGVEVRSPVDDLRRLLRQVRIALFPVRFGTGQSTKVLEAAESACALVATPQAVRGLAPIAAAAAIRDEPEELAARTVALLRNEAEIRSMGIQPRTLVGQLYSREGTLRRLAAIALR